MTPVNYISDKGQLSLLLYQHMAKIIASNIHRFLIVSGKGTGIGSSCTFHNFSNVKPLALQKDVEAAVS